MKITHLYHSGIMIETALCQIFIDVITPVTQMINQNKAVYFLVTHGHADHFEPAIFDLRSDNTTYVLSSDINGYVLPAEVVLPNSNYQFRHFRLLTLDSTDRGVAFVIDLEGKTILHSGDLNWWHWENDDVATQQKEADDFKRIVDQMPKRLDIAFVPVDPRLKSSATWTVEYYFTHKTIGSLFPIHFRDDYEFVRSIQSNYPEKTLYCPSSQNQIFEI